MLHSATMPRLSYPFVPHFPENLLRIIFEQAALNDRDTALQLALVAKQVREWCVLHSLAFIYSYEIDVAYRMDPIIYKSIIINSHRYPDQMKRPEDYANYVRELSLHNFNTRQRENLASLCTRVTKLQITHHPPLSDWPVEPHPLDTAIGNFRPRHLTTDINFVYNLPQNSNIDTIAHQKIPEFHRPFYSDVTHLCLLARLGLYTSIFCAGLGKLPKLTHLAVEVFTLPRKMKLPDGMIFREHIDKVCVSCPKLELLLIQVNSEDVLDKYNESIFTIKILMDPRVVVIIQGLPQRSRTGEEIQKIWPIAEAHVEMRRSGRVLTPICEVSNAIPFIVFNS